MKFFFWVRDFLEAYAKLHANSGMTKKDSSPTTQDDTYFPQDDTSILVQKAMRRLYNTPRKYYWIAIVCYFILEFFAPLGCGKFSRFSKLKEADANQVLEKLQNTKTYWTRLVLILCKSPVLSAKDEI